MKSNINNIIQKDQKFVIGMVHCLPLLGTMNFGRDAEAIYKQAVQDAITLEQNGVDAIIVENMGDSPFAEKLDVAQRVHLAVAADRVRQVVDIPIGIDAAFNDYQAAIAIAMVTGASFVRVPVFVDTVEFYGGIMSPCARQCMQYRQALGAEQIMILADIQVKHTNMLLPHIDMTQSAINAQACGAEAVIVTGSAIGEETPIEIIERVKQVVQIPVIAGSGVKVKNAKQQLSIADGAIIGSSFKKDGILTNPIEGQLVKALIDQLR